MPLSDHIRPDAYRPPTREEIERARAMYVEAFTISRILAATNMSLGTLYYWLDGGPRGADGPLLPPIPRRRVVIGKRRRPLQADPVSLTNRLCRTAERQARDIQLRLARGGAPIAERERDVRMLALLVKTLRELSAFEAGIQPNASEPDDEPRDMDALRAELCRRIGVLCAQAQADAQANTTTESGSLDPSP